MPCPRSPGRWLRVVLVCGERISTARGSRLVMGESRTVDPEAQLRDFDDCVATDGARLRRVLVACEGVA